MNFQFSKIELNRLQNYQDLFASAFPDATHLNMEYLKWLYFDNPDGNVQGFDAFYNGLLVGHYACIPVQCEIDGSLRKGLLSLNTATHPMYQGKGLFTQLAQMTYEKAISDNFKFVYGVANQNSTHGFVKKLGFELITPLDTYLLIGNIEIQENPQHRFKRSWTKETIKWRLSNPRKSYKNFNQLISVDTGKLNINCIATFSSVKSFLIYPSLFIGLKQIRSTLKIKIPDMLKPSPLNLIFRSLGSKDQLAAKDFEIQFLDFDAY